MAFMVEPGATPYEKLGGMRQALDDVNTPPELAQNLLRAFFDTADWMRNQPPPSSS